MARSSIGEIKIVEEEEVEVKTIEEMQQSLFQAVLQASKIITEDLGATRSVQGEPASKQFAGFQKTIENVLKEVQQTHESFLKKEETVDT